ncbi:hypothetical protein TSUD_208310 [Trifolium subterraneum]|uniref:Uncharacterized protein n=1 Tax=Trifolium subterraneum TaxID=3900 RepID=A0A2Z6MXA8_TRISU|nr:hypothetical protein TSUD_208310 [Trifolium subterraneum]
MTEQKGRQRIQFLWEDFGSSPVHPLLLLVLRSSQSSIHVFRPVGSDGSTVRPTQALILPRFYELLGASTGNSSEGKTERAVDDPIYLRRIWILLRRASPSVHVVIISTVHSFFSPLSPSLPLSLSLSL